MVNIHVERCKQTRLKFRVRYLLDFSNESAEGRWFFVEDKDLMDRIRELDEQRSLHYDPYASDSDVPDPVEFWDSEDEDGPLIEKEYHSNHFRTAPNPDNIAGFLIDAASMVASTPSLRKFILRHRPASDNDSRIFWADNVLIPYGRQLKLWYLRSGTSCDHQNRIVPADAPFVNTDRMYWRVGERWRPDPSIVEAWRRTVGPDVKYCFLKDIYDEEERTVTWDSTVEDDEKSRYGLDLEWEEPGGSIDLELGQLKKSFERNKKSFGPWTGKDLDMYRWFTASSPDGPLPEG